jgi:hypothetical protein
MLTGGVRRIRGANKAAGMSYRQHEHSMKEPSQTLDQRFIRVPVIVS